ncbi:MAG TPA: hypothetical protein EYN91_17000 [Candidatus Melainabacteria bacterium]|nr:hypothetical protein [Candidatus Melainabacteria bacterium]
MKGKRVLSVNGRNPVASALLLHAIERATGRQIAEVFDHIVTVSSGSVVAALFLVWPLTLGTKEPALALLDIFANASSFREQLALHFRGKSIRELRTEFTCICYELSRRERFIFSSETRSNVNDGNIDLELSLKASCSGSFLQDPLILETGKNQFLSIVDGSVFGEDPTSYALRELRRSSSGEPRLIVSLGTTEEDSAPSAKSKPTDPPSFESLILFSQAASGVVYQEEAPVFLKSTESPIDIVRLAPTVSASGGLTIDQASFERQITATEKYLSKESAAIESLASRLRK